MLFIPEIIIERLADDILRKRDNHIANIERDYHAGLEWLQENRKDVLQEINEDANKTFDELYQDGEHARLQALREKTQAP